jgi:hypothetical protein
MQALRLQIAGALLILLASSTNAAERSQAERRAFQRAEPCPANDQRRGPCPGYVVDHIVPLCAGGADRQENMQWQPLAESMIKDNQERQLCAAGRRSHVGRVVDSTLPR